MQSWWNNIKWIYNLSVLQKKHWYNLMYFIENRTGILSMILGTHRKSRKSTLETWPLISKCISYKLHLYPYMHVHTNTLIHIYAFMSLYFLSPHFFAYYTIKECKRESHVTNLCLFVVCLLFYYYNVDFIVQIGLILHLKLWTIPGYEHMIPKTWLNHSIQIIAVIL